jgi:hypothetical protein
MILYTGIAKKLREEHEHHNDDACEDKPVAFTSSMVFNLGIITFTAISYLVTPAVVVMLSFLEFVVHSPALILSTVSMDNMTTSLTSLKGMIWVILALKLAELILGHAWARSLSECRRLKLLSDSTMKKPLVNA